MTFVHPSNHITTPLRPEQIQPNTVDISLGKVEYFLNTHDILLYEDKKIHQTVKELELDKWGAWVLETGKSYSVLSEQVVNVPQGYIGWMCGRSTLNRNGVIVTSAIYDSGFHNTIGGILVNMSGVNLRIKPGTRFSHFVMAAAETVGMYAGDYGNLEVGQSR
jgi:deoxycytidine triphosphate deaminase